MTPSMLQLRLPSEQNQTAAAQRIHSSGLAGREETLGQQIAHRQM
jgi:hypothetical protein